MSTLLGEMAPGISELLDNCPTVRGLSDFALNKWPRPRYDIERLEGVLAQATETDRQAIQRFIQQLELRVPMGFYFKGDPESRQPTRPLTNLQTWLKELPFFEGVVMGIRNYSAVAEDVCGTLLRIVDSSTKERAKEGAKTKTA